LVYSGICIRGFARQSDFCQLVILFSSVYRRFDLQDNVIFIDKPP